MKSCVPQLLAPLMLIHRTTPFCQQDNLILILISSYNISQDWRIQRDGSLTIPLCTIFLDYPESWVLSYCMHSPLQLTPQVFNWVEVWGLRWPWEELDFVSAEPFLCRFRHLFWIIILLKDPMTTHLQLSGRGHQILI